MVTTGGIGVAHTRAGHVGIAYDYAAGADSVGLHVAVFEAPASSGAPVQSNIVTIGLTTGSNVGLPSTIAAGGSADVFHLAFVDQNAESLLYEQIAGATRDTTTSELVASGIGAGSYVSLAVSPTGLVRTSYYVPSTGSVESAARNAGGGFATPSQVTTGLDPNAPGTGQSSLVFDDDGTPSLLYQQCIVNGFSTPEFVTFDGTDWSEQKTIENADLNGYAGYSAALAISGANKYASYYFVAAGQSAPPTAELHLATWQLDSDQPAISILDSVIPANVPATMAELFRFQAALAVDKFGLLHLAIVRPSLDNQTASVEYMRQAVVNGTVKWLTDVVDGNVFAPDIGDLSPNAFVAITVDDDARPHIAYRSGATAAVYYATRLDR